MIVTFGMGANGVLTTMGMGYLASTEVEVTETSRYSAKHRRIQEEDELIVFAVSIAGVLSRV